MSEVVANRTGRQSLQPPLPKRFVGGGGQHTSGAIYMGVPAKLVSMTSMRRAEPRSPSLNVSASSKSTFSSLMSRCATWLACKYFNPSSRSNKICFTIASSTCAEPVDRAAVSMELAFPNRHASSTITCQRQHTSQRLMTRIGWISSAGKSRSGALLGARDLCVVTYA